MYDRQILIMLFLLLPTVSFSGEADKVNFKDVAISTSPVKEIKLSNRIYQKTDKYRKDISLTIQNGGEEIIVHAYFTVPVSSQLVWETLTDYDNIPSFISSVRSSKVLNRKGNTLHVSQNSIINYSIATFNFESVREINLVPLKKINERMISGNMKKMVETTQLHFDGNQTHITYQANIIPDFWILKYIGHSFIEDEAREQFLEIRNEIIRRKIIGYHPDIIQNSLQHTQNSKSQYNYP